MKIQKISRKLAFSTLLLALCSLVIWQGSREWELRSLTQRVAHANEKRRTPEQRTLWTKHNSVLGRLWLARNKRNVAPDLLVLLSKSQDADIQQRTVKAIGRLENVKTLGALRKWQATLTIQQKKELKPVLPLALARIPSTRLRGQKRLDAIAHRVGLSWDEIVRLSKKVNAPRANAQGTQGDEIVHEVANILYAMANRGQNVSTWRKQMLLSPAEDFLIQVAPLPPAQETNAILDYACGLKGSGYGAQYLIESHLIWSGSTAHNQLLNRLSTFSQLSKNAREKVLQSSSYIGLFRGAAMTGDKRAIKLLRNLEQDPNQFVKGEAWRARNALENKTWSPLAP